MSEQAYPGDEHRYGKDRTIASKALSTLYNPFSIRNNQPKWPDGLANYSIGRKQQFGSEVYGRDLVIALFPGSQNWCMCFEWKEGPNRAVILANHGDTRTFEWKTENTGAAGTETINYEPVKEISDDFRDTAGLTGRDSQYRYSGWRGVSYGLKLECCNSEEENDGWFECIRTSRNLMKHRFGVLDHYKEADVNPAEFEVEPVVNKYIPNLFDMDVAPGYMTVQEWYSARNWALNPSYASGKLKNIGNYVFHLNPESKLNPFQKLKPVSFQRGLTSESMQYWVAAFSNLESRPPLRKAAENEATLNVPMTEIKQNPPAEAAAHTPTGEDATNATVADDGDVGAADTGATSAETLNLEFAEHLIDNSFDIVLIRIHGVDSTRISMHSVANIELTCDEMSRLSQTQTICYPNVQGLQKYVETVHEQRRLPMQPVPPFFYT